MVTASESQGNQAKHTKHGNAPISVTLDGACGADDPLGKSHTVAMKIHPEDSHIEVVQIEDKYFMKRI